MYLYFLVGLLLYSICMLDWYVRVGYTMWVRPIDYLKSFLWFIPLWPVAFLYYIILRIRRSK